MSAGFLDFFTFGGLFVGQGTALLPTLIPTGHGSKVAGKLYFNAYMAWLQHRRELTRRRVLSKKKEFDLVSNSAVAEEERRVEHKKKCVEASIYNVLLAEL